ncbi:hypothetical protein HCN44_011299 [Aphidius gifuensis]|uniref:BRCT domain-containing protein n=1 Tax=Aphidius gifuensis TaxID=684658 RepID=A0A834XXM0_APHGI|nr:DNA repair protein XRCC1 [Aphidius gifuensis]KAF7994030.1 hypothetical protein HCN44_011299 [Aphidius gifuensis]
MIIKLDSIINCSSEHPDYPASNLLKNPSPGPWKCEKPGEMMTYVIFKLPEASNITGVDIGNYRCCIVIVTGSTSDDPDNWIPIVNHQFMTHDEAANNKWKDQVQLFTKKEISSTALNTKFDRIKVTCMQSANGRELFGLLFLILKTEVTLVDINADVFGKFTMKTTDDKEIKTTFKEKYLRLFPSQKTNYKDELKEKVKENALENFNKRQEEPKEPKKRPLLEKLEAGLSDEVFGTKKNDKVDNQTPVKRTPFGDIIPDESNKKLSVKKVDNESNKNTSKDDDVVNVAKKIIPQDPKDLKKIKYSDVIDDDSDDDDDAEETKTWTRIKNNVSDDDDDKDDDDDSAKKCSVCSDEASNRVCKKCNKYPKNNMNESPPSKKVKITKKLSKPFDKLMEDVSFSLSGYKNPQRDEIRRKALKMGAKYIPDPDKRNNKCSHLICAFKNTPKADLLRGHTKIVSHVFIEDTFDNKNRFSWRRYALSSKDKKQPESEDEIECASLKKNVYDQETDPESNSDCDY